MQLAVADIDRVDLARTALEKTIGETTRACPEVRTCRFGWIYGKRGESMVELLAPSAHKTLPGAKRQHLLRSHWFSRCNSHLPIDQYVTSHHHRPSPRSRFNEMAIY